MKWSGRSVFSGLLAFLVLLLAGTYVTFLSYTVARESKKKEMFNIMSFVERNIDQMLKQSYSATLTMALTISDEGVPQKFDSVAAQLLRSNAYIDAVQLVPDGVIKYVYPLEGNEPALNYDILDDSTRNWEAYMAIDTKQMYFAGPIKLKQGGVAVIGRMPVFIQNQFWGFSAVIIKIERLLRNSGIPEVNDENYHFQFSKVNVNTGEEEFFLPLDKEMNLEDSEVITFPEGDWKLYISTKGQGELLRSLLPLALICFVLSIVGGFFVFELVNRPIILKRELRDRSRELIKSERKFRTFFEQATIGVAHVESKTGKFLEVNDRYGKLLGYNNEELVGKTYRDIADKDDLREADKNMQKLLKGQIREFSMEKRCLQKNGKPVWVNVTVSPMWKENEEPTTHIAVVEDITERKNFQQLILESSIQAQEKEKNRIAKELHDGIVQELVACGIQCENLNNMFTAEGEVKKRLDQLTQLIKKITNDTRSISHNLLSADMNEMSLDELIDRLEHQFRSISSIDLKIQSHLEEDLPIPKEVKINLYRAIQELLTNILKHARATFASVIIELVDKEIYVTVRDNGIGIKDPSRMEKGIGLYNVKNRIYKLGGNVEYRQPANGGLEVSFNVPLYG